MIPILLQFNFENKFLNDLGLLTGAHQDFTPAWFKDIGHTLVFTMVLNAFIPSLCEYIGWLITVSFRCCDRSYSKRLRNPDGTVNTQCLIQEDVEDMYTGEPMYA